MPFKVGQVFCNCFITSTSTAIIFIHFEKKHYMEDISLQDRADQEVHIEKIVPEATGYKTQAILKTESTGFPNTDQLRPAILQ